MKKTNILYWTFTGLFSVVMLSSAIPNVLVTEEWKTLMTNLGYPVYLIPFLGVAKLLGLVVLLVPGFPRLKEWAYAGFFFDLMGATYSVIMKEGPQIPHIFMLVFFALLALSYIYYHQRLQLRLKQPSVLASTVAA
jgi:hypothetical protein